MNVIVLNGSPRGEKSCTMNLTRAFLEGAGWADAEIIEISKLNIKGCRGCFSCWTKTPGKCVISDDMAEMLPKLVEADVVICSFPLYGCFFPGEMKCFMDRQIPISLPFMDEDAESGGHPLRYDLSKQRQFYISTCGFWTAEGNYDVIYKLLERGGKENYRNHTIFCGQGELFNVPELKDETDKLLNHVRRAGREFANGMVSDELLDLISKPVFPKDAYESMADGSWETDK